MKISTEVFPVWFGWDRATSIEIVNLIVNRTEIRECHFCSYIRGVDDAAVHHDCEHEFPDFDFQVDCLPDARLFDVVENMLDPFDLNMDPDWIVYDTTLEYSANQGSNRFEMYRIQDLWNRREELIKLLHLPPNISGPELITGIVPSACSDLPEWDIMNKRD